MRQIVTAGILGAVVFFVWQWVSWDVLPWHTATIGNIPQELVVTDALKKLELPPGTYYFPAMPGANAAPALADRWVERHQQGPYGMLMYNPMGVNPMSGSVFAVGMLLDLVVAFAVAGLLWLARPSLQGYTQRVMLVTLVGLIVAASSHLMQWNWMHVPTDYSLVNAADVVVSFLLMGLAQGALVCSKSAAGATKPRETAKAMA